MPGRECYHCRQWIDDKDKQTHDCWTTTEEKLTEDLPDDLRDAWERIRETAMEFGEQRVYASHKSIMFARTNCYFFVRPTKKRLEVCFFIGRKLKPNQVKKIYPSSRVKVAHMVHVIHRDEVEAPLTEWLREAYDFTEVARTLKKKTLKAKAKKTPTKKKTKKKVNRRGSRAAS